MTDFAQLGFLIDATPIEGASGSLDKLEGSAKRAGAAADTTTSAYQRMREALTGSTGAQGASTQAYQQADQASKSYHETMRNVSAVNQEVEFGNQRMQRSLFMLGREVSTGEWTRMPMTLSHIVMHSGLTGAAITSIILPTVLFGAAVISLATAVSKGAEEQTRMNNALIVTNNFAGTTEDGILKLSSALAETQTMTIGVAKALVTDLAGSGQIAAGALANVSKLALEYATLTHAEIGKVAPELVKLFADPGKGAEELNKQLHFLNATQLEHIQMLEKTGQVEAAQLELSQKLLTQFGKQQTELGTLETKWNLLKQAASNAWDAMLGLGKTGTPDQAAGEVKSIDQRIFELGGGAGGRSAFTPDRQVLAAGVQLEIQMLETRRASLMILVQQGQTQKDQAAEQARITAGQQQGLLAVQNSASASSVQLRDLQATRTQLEAALALGKASGMSDEQQADARRKIYEIDLQMRDTRFNMTKEERAAMIQDAATTKQAQTDEYDRGLEIYRSLLDTKEITQEQYDLAASMYEIGKNQAAMDEVENQLAAGALPLEAEKLRSTLAHLASERELLIIKRDNKQFEDDEKRRLDLFNQALEHANDLRTKYWDAINTQAPQALRSIEAQTSALGQNETQHKVIVELLKLEKEGITAGSDAWLEWKAKFESAYAVQNQIKDSLSMWKEAAGWVSGFATALMSGASSAVQYLRDQLKKLLADMITIFATRWVLNMGASMTSGTLSGALTGAAEQVGAGTVANYLGGAGGSSLLGTMGSAAGTYLFGSSGVAAAAPVFDTATGVYTAGTAASGATGGALLTVEGELTATGWGVVIAAIIAVGYYFSTYHTGGPKTGGSSSQLPGDTDRLYTPSDMDTAAKTWTDATSEGYLQALKTMGGGSTSGLLFNMGFDMDPQGSAQNRASSRIYDSSGKVLWSQLNAEGEGGRDPADMQKLMTLESQRTILAALQLSELPKEVASIVNSLVATTATSQEITDVLNKAAEMAYVIKTLPTLNITGLDVASLQAFAAAGETISQTMARVSKAYSDFDNSFMSDSQKVTAAQNAVTAAFAQMGVAIPRSVADYYTLVHSIDVSTEAGRAMVTALMAVAPAFLAVQNAAAQATAQFNQLAGQLNPSFGASAARGNLESLVGDWITKYSPGWSIQQVITEIAGLAQGPTAANPGGFASAYAYIQSLPDPTAALSLFNQILAAYQTWSGAGASGGGASGGAPTGGGGASGGYTWTDGDGNTHYVPGTTPTATPTTGIDNLGAAAQAAADALNKVQETIADWLSRTMLSSSLSPLTPSQQLDFAQNQYTENLLKAQGGDIGALSKYSGYADTYLQAAKSYYGPTAQYQQIFAAIMAQGKDLAGLGDSGPLTNVTARAGFQAVVDAIKALQTSVGQNNFQVKNMIDVLASQAKANSAQLADAIRDGAL